MHRIHGNKWSIIADNLKGRSDNIVKNFFYAFIRKGITKINSIVGGLRALKEWRKMRPFDSEFTSKLILVNDGNYKDKVRLNNTDLELTAKGNILFIKRLWSKLSPWSILILMRCKNQPPFACLSKKCIVFD